MENKKRLSAELRSSILIILKERFEKNTNRHANLEWDLVRTKLEANPEKLWSLHEMERTGGEPDVVLPIRPKVLKAAEAFVTTKKHWIPEKNISPQRVLLKWH